MAETEKKCPCGEQTADAVQAEEKKEAEAEQTKSCCDGKPASDVCSDKKQKSGKCKKELEKEREAHAEEIKVMQEKLDALSDKFYRIMAEYDNFRKRSQKEKDGIYADTKAEVIGKLLPVIDNLERAALCGDDFDGYRKGIEMTVSQLMDIVKALGVEAFGEKGDEFDANLHNAVMHAEDEEAPENSVSEVFQKGYKMGDRVLRHAAVKVVN